MTDATERNEMQQLDPRKQRAVDLLAEGKTDSQVAAEIGVDRTTVWRWHTTDDAFRVELARRREELWRASADRMRARCRAPSRLSPMLLIKGSGGRP
jgi:FixJ family two-component response regulator